MICRFIVTLVSKLVCLATVLLAGAVFTPAAQALSGAYFGQTATSTPTMFASGTVSKSGVFEYGISFSPDGLECFFSTITGAMYHASCVNNVWTTPAVYTFQSGYTATTPFFSADGNKFYFTSNKTGSGDIYVSTRSGSSWGTPTALASPINSTSYSESMYSETTSGTACFISGRTGSNNIWVASGSPLQATMLPSSINISGIYNSFISSDGSYILFTKPVSNYGHMFVTFSDGNGGWKTPVDMNTYCPGINATSFDQIGASLSKDDKYLFFTRVSLAAETSIYWVANPFYVPEPATLVQLGLAATLLGLIGIRRIRKVGQALRA
jgi:Tol biopolymer transport system component